MAGGTVGDAVDRFLREEAKERGVKYRAPKPPKPPEELAYLIVWYDHCRAGMSRNMEVEPLSNQEILAFRDLHGLQDEMVSYDVQMLRRLDGAWFAARPKEAPKPDK